MKLKLQLRGMLLEVSKTKNDKEYAVIYCDGHALRVYQPSQGLNAMVGKEVTLSVHGFAKEVYLEQTK